MSQSKTVAAVSATVAAAVVAGTLVFTRVRPSLPPSVPVPAPVTETAPPCCMVVDWTFKDSVNPGATEPAPLINATVTFHLIIDGVERPGWTQTRSGVSGKFSGLAPFRTVLPMSVLFPHRQFEATVTAGSVVIPWSIAAPGYTVTDWQGHEPGLPRLHPYRPDVCSDADRATAASYGKAASYEYVATRCDLIHEWHASGLAIDVVDWLAREGYPSPLAGRRVGGWQ